MAEESNSNDTFKYRKTEWRRFIEYRLDELKGGYQEVSKKVDTIIVAGIVTPATLDQKLKDQKESCVTQFKEPSNPNGLKGGWSLAKWGIKEFGVFGALVVMNLCLIALLMRGQGII